MIDGEKSTLVNFQRYRSTSFCADLHQSINQPMQSVATTEWLQIVLWLSHLLWDTIYSIKKIKFFSYASFPPRQEKK